MMQSFKNFYNPANSLIGTVTKKSSRKLESPSYSEMMEKRIAKRRAKNKVAAKSRRLNRIRQGTKHCKFYMKG